MSAVMVTNQAGNRRYRIVIKLKASKNLFGVNVSAERIRTELTKLLVSDGCDRLLLLAETGLSCLIPLIPEHNRHRTVLYACIYRAAKKSFHLHRPRRCRNMFRTLRQDIQR